MHLVNLANVEASLDIDFVGATLKTGFITERHINPKMLGPEAHRRPCVQ